MRFIRKLARFSVGYANKSVHSLGNQESRIRLRCGFTLFFHLLCPPIILAAEVPRQGADAPALRGVEEAVVAFYERIGASAATMALSRNGQLVYSRGFGWSDKEKRQPVAPDALMRIASVSKPLTAAAIKNAVRAGQLSLDTKAFELLKLQAPQGKIADARLLNITVGQLLEHEGGWDRSISFDPMFITKKIETELHLTAPATAQNVIEYMMTQPLQFEPGRKKAYSNFGYCVLGRLLETVQRKPFIECLQELVLKPLGVEDIKLARSALTQRDAREVWYPVRPDAFPIEIMDAHGGLMASAPALCRFLDKYWINGEPRRAGKSGDWTSFGSLPGTTAMVRQRRDGWNVAVLFNARRDGHFEEDNLFLKAALDKAIDELVIP
jgi:CubicO group peptidase (beta-lactamase class C family)